MTAKITTGLNTLVAKSFRDNLRDTTNDDEYYAFICFNNDSDLLRYTDSDATNQTDEFIGGITPQFGIDDQTYYMQHAITAHKLAKGGVSRVVKRVNWVSGTTYKANSYVLVTAIIQGISRLNVYKVLHYPGIASSSSPSGDNSTPIISADGYRWQYLYTIDASDSLKFLTKDYMPVPEQVLSSEAQELNPGTSRYKQFQVQRDSYVGGIYHISINDSDFEVWGRAQYGSWDLIPTTSTITIQNATSTTPATILAGTISKTADSDFSFNLTTPGIGYAKGSIAKIGALLPKGLDVEVAPGLGHGTNSALELNASNVMVTIRNTPDGGVTKFTKNNFRMINLIRNPIDRSTNKVAKNDFFVACKSFIASDSDGGNASFNVGNVVATSAISGNNYHTTTGKVGRIVAVDTTKKQYYYVSLGKNKEKDSFSPADNLQIVNASGALTGNPLTVASISNREILFNSGDIIVADIRDTTTTRAVDQIESFNFVLTF